MSYIITNGNNYIRATSTGKVVAVADAHQARVFQSEERANIFCECLPNAYKKLNYHVVPYEGVAYMKKQQAPADEVIKAAPLIPAAEDLDERAIDIEYITTTVKNFEDMILLLKSQQKQIEQEKHHAEAQIFDVEHIAEFSTLNAPKAYKVYKVLHDARVRRRKCKDSLDILMYISELLSSEVYDRKMSKILDGMKRRTFTPRALPELYSELCEEQKEAKNADSETPVA